VISYNRVSFDYKFVKLGRPAAIDFPPRTHYNQLVQAHTGALPAFIKGGCEFIMRHHYQTRGTCSTQISFDLEGNIVRGVEFQNGCDGNLKAIQRLVEGFTVEQVVLTLGGITCGRKDTSCADQLSKAVRVAYEEADG